jgi:DNA polymerase-3 subunit beta
MKILCDRHLLQEAFSVVASVAPPKSPKPIVQNVLLTANDNGLTLFATDFEMSAQVTLGSVKVHKPGSALLPAREAAALFRELSDPTLTIECKNQRSAIECGGGSFLLTGDDPEQFPAPVTLASEKSITLAGGDFLELVRKAAFAAAKEETRYAIHGALLDVRGGAIRMVATDGRRLALCYRQLDGTTPECSHVVPLRALAALQRAIPEGSKENLKIRWGENLIGFEFGGVQLISRLLDCRFPDFESVIPKAADTTIELSRELLYSNLKKVAVMCAGDLRMVRFQFNSSSLELSTESQSGRADLTMDADVKGAGGTITFNPDYVIEALRVSDPETIRIDMSDDSTPAKFTLGEAFSYVLMPISGS